MATLKALLSGGWWGWLVIAVSAVMGVAEARGQCPAGWTPGDAYPGINGVVNSIARLPNGDLVAGGYFSVAGDSVAVSVARWDGSRWHAVGGNQLVAPASAWEVRAVAVLPNGDIVAGGTFGSIAGVPAGRVARWNGSTWSALGAGVSGSVYALAVMPNGDLIAGGEFLLAGGVTANRVARWNGTSWSALGNGTAVSSGSVQTLLSTGDGRLLVGGNITVQLPGGATTAGIASWDGSSWSSFSSGMSEVLSIVRLPSGDIVAGGGFTTAGGVSARNIARWNGSGWQPLAGGVQGGVFALAALPNGDVIAGGSISSSPSGPTLNRVGRWNGTAWSPLGAGISSDGSSGQLVRSIVLSQGGEVFVAGDFGMAGSTAACNVARFDGVASWSALPVAGGASSSEVVVWGLTVGPDGTLYAAGDYTTPSGALRAGGIFKRGAAGWERIGPAITASVAGSGVVQTVGVLPNGDLVAGGAFTSASGVPANNVARWDGTAWRPLGLGVNGTVESMVVLPNGLLVVAGGFFAAGEVQPVSGIASWNGAAWASIDAHFGGSAKLAVADNGDLLVGYGGVARWDGVTWTDYGYPLPLANSPRLTAIAAVPGGGAVAAYWYTTSTSQTPCQVYRLDGTNWSAVGSTMGGPSLPQVKTLAILPGGDIFAGGFFTTAGGVPAKNMARCSGSVWSEFEGGATRGLNQTLSPRFSSSQVLPGGDLVVGGTFTTVGAGVSTNFARYSFGGGGIVIDGQPGSVSACAGASAVLSVSAVSSEAISYLWQKDGVAIDPAVNPTAATAALTVVVSGTGDAGRYRCAVSGRCASVLSESAWLFVAPADVGVAGGLAGSDGLLDNNDFIAFIGLFFEMDARADLGRAGGELGVDGVFDNNDFIVFINEFFAGC